MPNDEPIELDCGCCGKAFGVADKDLQRMKDVQCPSCTGWNEIHATEWPPSSRLSYYLKCREE